MTENADPLKSGTTPAGISAAHRIGTRVSSARLRQAAAAIGLPFAVSQVGVAYVNRMDDVLSGLTSR
jgi:S-adenosylmethionine synthetase